MAWRGAGKPAHYNLDYSRFNAFDDAEEKEQAPAGFYEQALRNPNLPPELRQAFHLSQVAKETGDAAKQKQADDLVRAAISRGGPEIQERFKQTLGEMSATKEFQEKAKGMQMPSAEQFLAGDVGVKPDGSLKSQIEGKLHGTQSALASLLAQQSQLEAIAKSQDPAQIGDFFMSQGWTEDQVQRALADKEYAMELFSSKLPNVDAVDHEDGLAEKASEECDAVLDAIHDAFPDRKPAQAKSKSKVAAPAQATAKVAPAATFTVTREGAEEVIVVSFPPEVRSMADVELDVAPGLLRLQGAFAPVLVPLPGDVATDGVQAARFSKKRSELTVRLSVKP